MTDKQTRPPSVTCTAPGLSCPHLKSTYDGWDGERYRCEVCGKSVWLDYEDMK